MATKSSKSTTESDSSTQMPGPDTTTVVVDGETDVTTVEPLPDTSLEQSNEPSESTTESDSSTQTPGSDTTTVVVDGETAVTTVDPLPDTSLEQGNESGTVVPTGEVVSRKSVVFITAYHRYVRGDQATFDDAYATELVDVRSVAVWPKDAKKALAGRPGELDHDLDIG